jgi:hypothetical protein
MGQTNSPIPNDSNMKYKMMKIEIMTMDMARNILAQTLLDK